MVHSYNRVINDIFEDDQINKTQVSEASFDVNITSKYDTFFNLSSGISSIDNKYLKLSYEKDKKKITKSLKVNVPDYLLNLFIFQKSSRKNLMEVQ